MKTTTWIGGRCKPCEGFSRAVLIARELSGAAMHRIRNKKMETETETYRNRNGDASQSVTSRRTAAGLAGLLHARYAKRESGEVRVAFPCHRVSRHHRRPPAARGQAQAGLRETKVVIA